MRLLRLAVRISERLLASHHENMPMQAVYQPGGVSTWRTGMDMVKEQANAVTVL